MNIAQIRQCLCDCNLDDGQHVSPVVALCNVLKNLQPLDNYDEDQRSALKDAAQCVAEHDFHGMRAQAEALLSELGSEA
ncbi:MAG: hypothetical protein PVF65_12680 [Sphingomonadales bacterium]|jgi:hypothetical protein